MLDLPYLHIGVLPECSQTQRMHLQNKPLNCFCPQGEQCNIVPDNVDDIVADIAQEEKEEGLDPVSISLSPLLKHGWQC